MGDHTPRNSRASPSPMIRPLDGDLSIDTVLRNTYKVVSILGRGGMGSVYLAQHLRLPGKQVAVKVLRGGDHLTPEIFARFRREAEIASRLGHPNIVEVLDYDTLDDGTPFLVLEFLRGESLQSRLERGRLPLADVYSFTRQMGSALQAAHGAGIVHRDLKPANVFLVPTDSGGVVGERLKLLDFGISKVLDSGTVQTQEATLIGTPQYMSPEQAQGRNRETDARTDIFAMGCIVYEMMTGTPAFGGGGIAQMIFRVVYEPPAPLAPLCPEAPPHAIAAVDKALAKRVEERYQDIASFVEALTGSPLHTLSSVTGSHATTPRPTGSPSGVALPSEGPPSLSNTMAPGSVRQGPDTGRMGFEATMAPGTGRMGQVEPVAPSGAFAAGNTGRMGVAQALGAEHVVPPVAQLDPVQLEPTLTSQPVPRLAPAQLDPPGLEPTLMSQPVPGPAAPAHTPHVPAVTPQQPNLHVAAVSTTTPVPATKSRTPLAALAVAGLVVIGGAGWWMTRSGPTPSTGAPVPANPQGSTPAATTGTPAANSQNQGTTPPPPTVTGTPPPPATGTPGDTGTQAVPPPQTGTATPPGNTVQVNPTGVDTKTPPPSTRPSTRPEPSEKLSDEVRQLLTDAERALSRGDTAEAIRLARSSQRREPNVIPQASYSLLTRAFCRQKDLGNAKTQWPKVSGAEKSRVRKYCQQYDIEF